MVIVSSSKFTHPERGYIDGLFNRIAQYISDNINEDIFIKFGRDGYTAHKITVTGANGREITGFWSSGKYRNMSALIAYCEGLITVLDMS